MESDSRPEEWKPNIPPGQEQYVMRKPNGDWWCLLCRKCATDEHFTGTPAACVLLYAQKVSSLVVVIALRLTLYLLKHER